MQLTDSVAQVNGVLLTRAAAVFVGGSATEEGAEDAVLHMKEGHMLMESELEPLWWGLSKKVENLIDIEIVGDGEPIEGGFVLESLGSDGIGDVEGEITDFDEVRAVAKEVEGCKVAEKNPIWIHAADVLKVACFASFDDPRGRKNDLRVGV